MARVLILVATVHLLMGPLLIDAAKREIISYGCCVKICACKENGEVDCSGNGDRKLSSVPEKIPKGTISLNLKSNNIREIPKGAFRNLTRLRILKMSNNKIRKLNNGVFEGLGNLRILGLSSNGLREVSIGVFKPLKNLQTLQLNNNPLFGLVAQTDIFLPLVSLQILKMNGASLNGTSFLTSLKNAKHLSQVHLDRNRLGAVSAKSFFGLQPSRPLTLSLSNSGITQIAAGTFSSISFLKHLDLSGNAVNSSFPRALQGLGNTKLTHLYLNNIDFRSFTKSDFEGMWNCLKTRKAHDKQARLITLSLERNNLVKLLSDMFIGLGHLKVLNLAGNPFDDGFGKTALQGLESLEALNAQNCSRMSSFPKFFNISRNVSYTPNLGKLNFSGTPVVIFPDETIFRGLEYLKILDLYHAFVRGLVINEDGCLKALDSLNLGSTSLDTLPLIRSKTLRILDISSNHFEVKTDQYKRWSVPNLEVLNLHGNRLQNMSRDGKDTMKFFSIFSNLKTLKMGDMRLFFLPQAIFDNMPNLTRLELPNNRLNMSILAPRYFKNLKNLQFLYLAANSITTVPRESLTERLWKDLLKLDLSDNPFNCDCELQWFSQFMKVKWKKKWGDLNKYICQSPSRSGQSHWQVTDYPFDNVCLREERLILGLGISGGLFVVILCATFRIFQRYRWHIKFRMYRLRRWLRGAPLMEFDGSNYEWDIFVGSHKDDVRLIKDIFLPELEKKRGYRLFINERNGLLCEFVLENIMYSINNSFKSLLCLSNNLVQAPWSQFLIGILIQRLMKEKQNSLVCILLEDIEEQNLLDALEGILTEGNYIRLPEVQTNEAMNYFWARVDEALRKPVIPNQNPGPIVPLGQMEPDERSPLLDLC